LERLAGESERGGAHDRAVHWWRRLAAHEPFSSRIALRLMHALAAAGDRAAAVQHARVHAALLREELEVEPDPLVQALAAELAAAPTPTPESRPSTPARPAGPAAADAGALDMPGAATPPPSAPHLAEAVAIASAGAQPENPSASAAKR